jgi:phospholipase/lecithinase/hemolysin
VKTLRTSLVCLVLALVAPMSAAAQSPKFDAFYVFGDSLGDTGNDWILTRSLGADPAIPPSESPHKTYFRGRFSNGPILFEHFWSALSSNAGPVTPSLAVAEIPRKGAISFAYGGSTTGDSCFPFPGLKCQVEEFAQLLGTSPPPKRALYAVFSGANDVLGAPNPFDPTVVGGIVTNVSDVVRRLYALGARDVMVLNMPNLGVAPIVQDPDMKFLINQLAQQHNLLLAKALSDLSSALPGIRIIPVDVYTFFESLISTSAFNFEMTALPPEAAFCLFDGATPVGSNCPDVPTFNVDRSYFFWDIEHPTKSAHATIGAFLYRELKAAVR